MSWIKGKKPTDEDANYLVIDSWGAMWRAVLDDGEFISVEEENYHSTLEGIVAYLVIPEV